MSNTIINLITLKVIFSDIVNVFFFFSAGLGSLALSLSFFCYSAAWLYL